MTARDFDHKAKGLAKTYQLTEGELLSVLMEMRRLKLFVDLNCTGIFDFVCAGYQL